MKNEHDNWIEEMCENMIDTLNHQPTLKMNHEYLERIFNEVKEDSLDICVEVTIPGQDETEFIINKNASIENKLAYYKKTYNDQLIHNHCKDIQIVSIKAVNLKEVLK